LYRGLAALDFDGTLHSSRCGLPEANRRTLEILADKAICRAVVTGRSLQSFIRAAGEAFPLDYLVFSSGAGILRWKDRTLLSARQLTGEETAGIAGILREEGLDFMIQEPIPENHRFVYHRANRTNRDFEARIAVYRDTARPLEGTVPDSACQFVAVLPPERSITPELRNRLAGFSLVRATSPLDGLSTWLEIFPSGVDKRSGTLWLQEHLGLAGRPVVGVGNDYNDEPLLEWAQSAWVVAGAPEELKRKFAVTGACEEGGAGSAVKSWFEEKFPGEPWQDS